MSRARTHRDPSWCSGTAPVLFGKHKPGFVLHSRLSFPSCSSSAAPKAPWIILFFFFPRVIFSNPNNSLIHKGLLLGEGAAVKSGGAWKGARGWSKDPLWDCREKEERRKRRKRRKEGKGGCWSFPFPFREEEWEHWEALPWGSHRCLGAFVPRVCPLPAPPL